MIVSLLFCSFIPSYQPEPDAPKDPVVDIKTFKPTREPKKIPEDLRATGPFDDDFPIPQDAKIAEANRTAALAWSKKMFLSGFDATADKTAAWYANARKGLESQAALFVSANPRDSRHLDPMIEGYRLALLAECNHPFVQLQAFPHLGFRGEENRGYSAEYGRIVDEVLKGPYVPLVKADEALTAAIKLENAQQASGIKGPDYYGHFWTHFVELCKSTDPQDMDHAAGLANRVIDRYVQIGQKRADGWKAVSGALTMAKADPALRGLCEGAFRLAYARDAQRGNADADEKAKLFKERVALARKSLSDAAAKNPNWSTISLFMIRVCTAEDAPREEMEKWYTAAMQADPDNFAACQAKLDYFDRPNDRNAKAMVTFGRQCLRTNNEHAFLGLILFEAHMRIKRTKPDDDNYWGRAEPWADVREVFETRLKSRPDDRFARSRWGLHCLQAGEGPGAYHNLLAVKKNPWADAFRNLSFESAVTQARLLAQQQEMIPE